jgi:hypothetical protein
VKSIAAFFGAPLVGALLAAAPAQAVTGNILFDFRGGFSLGASSFSYSQGGVDLTVTAGTADGGGVDGGAKVTKGLLGLGVKSWLLDQQTVDGLGDKDVLIFAANKNVKVHELWFAKQDGFFSGDQFKLYDEGASGLQTASGAINVPSTGGLLKISQYVLGTPLAGDLFGVGATDHDDNWRLAKLSLSVVPGPAPILLLLGAFGALAVTLRGRKAA